MTNFDYYKPDNKSEAYNLYMDLKNHVYYYAGGTELVTTMRKGKMKVDALIDLKGIEGIKDLKKGELGACVSLNDLEVVQCQMLSDVAFKIADHTVRNAITLGGNVCGRLPYKEMILPLLAMNAEVEIVTAEGLVRSPVESIFDKRFLLKPGEFVYKFYYEQKELKFFYERVVESTTVDYPVMTLLAVKRASDYFVGFSGLSAVPVYETFEVLDFDQLTEYFSKFVKGNMRSCDEYRIHLMKDVFRKALEVFND